MSSSPINSLGISVYDGMYLPLPHLQPLCDKLLDALKLPDIDRLPVLQEIRGEMERGFSRDEQYEIVNRVFKNCVDFHVEILDADHLEKACVVLEAITCGTQHFMPDVTVKRFLNKCVEYYFWSPTPKFTRVMARNMSVRRTRNAYES